MKANTNTLIFFILCLFTLSGCSAIDSILWEPITTPEEWCATMPCVEMGAGGWILNQPFSTFLVYLLGAMWLWAGWHYWVTRESDKSKLWWSFSLVLGGVAAMTAGTSYQAFSYELKCAAREVCVWTNGWEITYMVLQVACLNTMLVAVAYSCSTGQWRKRLMVYAALNSGVHSVMVLLGVILANRFLLSFELVVLFTVPTFAIYFSVNGWRYAKQRQALDLALLGSWLLLVMTNALYFGYLLLGYTQVFWEAGFWFSENDVLHVCMIVWVLYVVKVLKARVKDHPGR